MTKPGLSAHQRRAGLGGQRHCWAEVRVQRVAVDQHRRRAVQQRRDQRVPHHPGGGREPQQPVARRAGPSCRRVVLQVLEQDPAVAVHDRLRLAGGAGGEQHAQRVVERAPASNASGPGSASSSSQRDGVRDAAVAVRHVRRRARRVGQPGADLGHLVAAVDRLVAVDVAGDGEQHRRLDLAEPVDDAARPELRGAARPHRAEARGGEEGDERSRGCWAGRRPPGRRGRHRGAAARRGRGRPGRRSSPQVSSRAVAGLRVARSAAGAGRVVAGRPTACSA